MPVRRPRSLRHRAVAAILTVTGAALVVFAVPLGYAVHRIYQADELTSLERDAVRLTDVTPETVRGVVAHPPGRPAGLPAHVQVGVYRTDGRRIWGAGPPRSALAAQAGDGLLHAATAGDTYAASAPVPSEHSIAVTVRVAASAEAVEARTRKAWLVMAGLAVAVLALAAAVTRVQAARLVRPLERLAGGAKALGMGAPVLDLPPSGITEVDEAGVALERTAGRLARLHEREQLFTRDVSHQLRTPLAGLLLGLEAAQSRPDADLRRAIDKAVDRTRRLQGIIDDLLTLTRAGSGSGAQPLDGLLADVRQRWQGPLADAGRALDLRPAAPEQLIGMSPAAFRQILDVLVGNALRHGAGTVTVSGREVPGGVAVDVSDEGGGLPPPRRRREGIGLPLARSLAEAFGGRLVVVDDGPRPVFRLLVPEGSYAEGEQAPPQVPDASAAPS